MSGLTVVGLFLLSLFFGLIISSLWLRIALRYLRVSSLNPLSQLIYTVTNPLVNPVDLVFKPNKKPSYKYDWTALMVLVLIEFLKIICLSLLILHAVLPFVYLLLYVVADLIIQPCNLFFYAILIRVIMSFVKPDWNNPMAGILYLLTEPLLRIGRRIIPDISGFDFSPFIMLIILKIISLAITNSLPLKIL